MGHFLAYRYDNQLFAANEVIAPRGDSISMLTEAQRQVEVMLRQHSTEAEAIRKHSLYVWADENVARRLFRLSKKAHLYELQIDELDVNHRGDLNFYSLAVDQAKSGLDITEAVRAYWSGESLRTPDPSRIEILVRKATVVREIQL